MKASSALTQPGDAARRESDGAVAVWMYEFGSDPVKIKVMAPHVQTWWTPGQDIPGDDWHPLQPAGELEAEVKRLTAERDEARRERDSFREKRDAARAKGRLAAAQAVERDRAIDALTARVAELEASIEKFGSCIFNTRGDLEHVELGTDQLNALMAEFVRHFPSPLPTAGEEGKSWAWSKEDSERRKKVEAWVEATDPDMIRRGLEDIEAGRVVPLEDVIAEEAPAPAEPDSPAEECEPFRFDPETWLVVCCQPHSDLVEFSINHTEEGAERVAADWRKRGGYVFATCKSGELVAALTLLRNRRNGGEHPAEEREAIPIASVVLSQAIGNGGKGVHMRVPRDTSTPPTVTISFKSERHAERAYREAVRLVDGVDLTDAAAEALRAEIEGGGAR